MAATLVAAKLKTVPPVFDAVYLLAELKVVAARDALVLSMVNADRNVDL